MLAILGCFALLGCTDENAKEGCFIDEKSDAFASGYHVTVTDVVVTDSVTVDNKDYNSQFDEGKFVSVYLTLERDKGSEDVIFLRNWFTLSVGDANVLSDTYLYNDVTVNDGARAIVILRFDVESASDNMVLTVADPNNTDDKVTVTLTERK
jgi:hypothetical protein